jgi:hypothetical protein
MPVAITSQTLKEIAEYLDSGMICFYHIPTGQLEYYPDELRGYVGFDQDVWQEIIDKVENNYHEYIRFGAMESHDSFRLLETFVASIAEKEIRQRFEDAISFKKPFQNFKQLLYNYPELRQQWFDFKKPTVYRMGARTSKEL